MCHKAIMQSISHVAQLSYWCIILRSNVGLLVFCTNIIYFDFLFILFKKFSKYTHAIASKYKYKIVRVMQKDG